MANNYDSIAAVYDRIHHLFYGQSEVNAQVELLDHVNAGDRLLIVGGGTGWILEKIAGIYPEGLTIVYVESSQKMMERSMRRDWGGNKVEFFTGPVEEWPGGPKDRPGSTSERPGGTEDRPDGPKEWPGAPSESPASPAFDCILTGFFFDNFKQDHSLRIVRHLTPSLKSGGYWLETDFYYPRHRGKLWQAALLWIMYTSARIICGVEAKRLPDLEPIFSGAGYTLQTTSFHYQRFIRSLVFRKS